MSRYIQQGVFVDGQGAIVPSGTISVYLTGTTTAASIYTASSGGTAVNSVTSGSDGSWSFYVDTDDYAMTQNFDITLSKTDFTAKTYSDIKIFPAADSQIILQDVSGKTVRDLFDAGYDVPIKPSKIFGGASNTSGHTVPNIADDTFTLNAATQTLTNKTLGSTTAPVVDFITKGPYIDPRSYGNDINAAVAAAAGKTVVVYDAQTLTASLTVPATVGLLIMPGGSIVKASTYTLTINGPFEAGLYQVFSGFSSGNVTFGITKEVYPEWWGAVGDFATDDTSAIALAIASVNTGSAATTGGKIKFTNRYLTDPITLSATDTRIVIEGVSNTRTQIKLNDSSDATLITIAGGRVVFKNLLLDGNRANQAAGNVMTISSGVPHVTLYNVSCYNGYLYGLGDFGTTTHAFACIFSSNDYGVKVGNNTTHFYGCTFEDNLSGGALCEGAATVIMGSFDHCWFEDNALGLTNPSYHIKGTGIGALNSFVVTDCYFSGGTQPTIMAAISIAGSVINNWKFTNNQIFNCDLGVYALPNNMWNYRNDFRNNQVAGSTPAIADSDRKPGFLFDDSSENQIYISPTIDLSGAAVTYSFVTATGTRYVTIKKITAVYSEASSADAGIALAVELNATGTDLVTYTSETGQAQWSANDVTITTNSTTLDGDKTLTLRSPGGKTGTGEVSIQIQYTLW